MIRYSDDPIELDKEIDSISAYCPDFILVWGDEAQVPRLIVKLRHAGYSGSILAPSFLANYEALGVNAGKAGGICFAA